MHILVIGDNQSFYATRYLHDIAAANGERMYVVALVNWCDFTVEGHHRAIMFGNLKKSEFTFNGMRTPIEYSVADALALKKWDYIVIQPGQREGPEYEAYAPYIGKICEKLHDFAPAAKILLNEPWAYAENSNTLKNTMGYTSQAEMIGDIEETCNKIYEENGEGLYGIIPSCESLRLACESGLFPYENQSEPSDAGKYLLGLVWYQIFSKKQIKSNRFRDFDTEIDEATVDTVKACAYDACKNYGWR